VANEIENVIEDSLNDASVEDLDTGADESVDTAAADMDTDVDADPVEAAADPSAEVVAPAVKDNVDKPIEGDGVAKPEDEFAKKFGISAQSVTGRENRIPYSRVKKIVEKNERDTIARVTKELETKFAGGSPEIQTQLKEYETLSSKVNEFEQTMVNDPRTHLGRLATLPAYKEFFEAVNKAFETPAAGAGAAKPVDPNADMPQPDQPMPDGSRVYSMDGLKALMAWQGKQVEDRVNKGWQASIDKRFGPIEQEWKSREQLARLVPEIDKQITEARKWPNFNELEPAVVKLLDADPNTTLESAYRQAYQAAVVPKLTADRNKIRSEVLAEIQKRPVATASPSAARPKSAPVGPQKTEDVITQALRDQGINIQS
jgi:hypothetical protein